MCIPELYREVDLSSHNLGRITENEDEFHCETWANLDDFNRPENLLPRQRYFLRTLQECPHYASYVRSFAWTMIWYDQHDEDGLAEIDYHLWAIFSQLQRVTKLDLAAIAHDKPLEAYTRQVPSVIFPQVKELRLTGWMPHNLVASILNSINLSDLRVLSLNALQEEGSLPDGSPMPESLNNKHWDSKWRVKLCEHGKIHSDSREHRIIFPGPMWLPFLHVIGKFDSLQHLEITIPPFEEINADQNPPEFENYISTMVELIDSVNPTLKSLVIDYARRRRYGCANPLELYFTALDRRRPGHSGAISRSMFSLFSEPEDSKWGSLLNVSLKGFLQSFQFETSHATSIHDIKGRLEEYLTDRNIEFQWSDHSPQPAFLFLGHDYVVSDVTIERFDQLVEEVQKI